jgi:hypothetical protein
MKAVTIHLDEAVYREFQAHAKVARRSTSELIRDAMAAYRDSRLKPSAPLWCKSPPVSVGKFLRPIGSREDITEDFWQR